MTKADKIRQLTKEEITGAIAVLERLQEGYIKYESEKPEREVAASILVGALDVAITVMKQEVEATE